jgi:hypothetical protein
VAEVSEMHCLGVAVSNEVVYCNNEMLPSIVEY